MTLKHPERLHHHHLFHLHLCHQQTLSAAASATSRMVQTRWARQHPLTTNMVRFTYHCITISLYTYPTHFDYVPVNEREKPVSYKHGIDPLSACSQQDHFLIYSNSVQLLTVYLQRMVSILPATPCHQYTSGCIMPCIILLAMQAPMACRLTANTSH